MRLDLLRFAALETSTIGALSIDGRFACFTLEDQFRAVKVPGETRIPAGEYALKLRAEGGLHEKYRVKYPEHRGMLHLQDVPGFEWIYLHPGTIPEHTLGCILVADKALSNGTLEQSVPAYRRLYGIVSDALLKSEPVRIRVIDEPIGQAT